MPLTPPSITSTLPFVVGMAVKDDPGQEETNPLLSFNNMVIIAGATGAVLAVVILIAVGLVICFVLRKKQQQKEAYGEELTSPLPTPGASSTNDIDSPTIEMVRMSPSTNEESGYIETAEVVDDEFLKTDSEDENDDTDNPMHGIT